MNVVAATFSYRTNDTDNLYVAIVLKYLKAKIVQLYIS